jgi:hypothetical protein
MNRLSSGYRRSLVFGVLVAYVAIGNLQLIGGTRPSAAGGTGQDGWHLSTPSYSLTAWDEPDGYIIEAKGQHSTCRLAAPDEARALLDRGSRSDLHIINPRPAGLLPQSAGLQITLMGTPQLDTFPQAKTAFVNAAANWQARIKTPISIVIDVDFGPMAFGTTFGMGVLGQTAGQSVGSNTLYPVLRQALIAGASNQDEASLYNSLSVGVLQTDIGTTSAVAGPATELRATGILPATADPAGEMAQLGPPPAIAFNSNFQFTFDPSGGIVPNTTDFDAVATHEIGHVLGFNSRVGVLELSPGTPLALSQLDIFRTAPGATSANFGSRTRTLSSGGMQDFYFGSPELAFSTGKPDGTGGDGNQAGHWKSVVITGILIGIMDPSIAKGERRTISDNDLRAFQAIGYRDQIAGPNGNIALTSGVSSGGSVGAPGAGSCFLGSNQYTIQVPAGATQLQIDLTGNQPDVELFARFGQQVTITGGRAVADFSATSVSPSQEIVVSASTNPPLAGGTYFFAVGNCSQGLLNYSITATVSGGTTADPPPAINSLSADLQGNNLVLTGTASDADGDLAQADITFLDGNGAVVGDTNPFAHNFGTSTSSSFSLTASLQGMPTAVTAGLALIDAKGRRTATKTADFGQGDPNGPQITSGSFDGGNNLLSVKGSGFDQPIQLESNGAIVSVRIKIKGGGVKLKIPGAATDLGFQTGPNRIRIFVNSLRSNIFIVTD